MTQSYLPQAQRLQRDLGRQALDLMRDLEVLHAMQTAPASSTASPEEAVVANERARLEAICLGQAFATFQQLSADLSAGLDTTQELEAEVQHMLLQVQDCVGSSAAVSKETVYPLFDRLGSLHTSLSEELRLLVVRQRLYEEAVGMLGGFPSMLPPSVKPGAKPPPPNQWITKLALPSSLEQTAIIAIEATPASEEGTSPSLPEGFEFIPAPAELTPQHAVQLLQSVSLSGFCAASLASEASPSVRLVKPSLGFVKVQETGEVLGFASPDALTAFAKAPAAVLAAVDEAVLKQPLLAKLLGRSGLHPSLQTQVIQSMMTSLYRLQCVSLSCCCLSGRRRCPVWTSESRLRLPDADPLRREAH